MHHNLESTYSFILFFVLLLFLIPQCLGPRLVILISMVVLFNRNDFFYSLLWILPIEKCWNSIYDCIIVLVSLVEGGGYALKESITAKNGCEDQCFKIWTGRSD